MPLPPPVTSHTSLPQIACGVAGWSYDDWNDTVYRISEEPRQLDLFEIPPEQRKKAAPKDRLAFLAQFVNMIEINS